MKIVYCIAKTCASGGMERVLSVKANYLASLGYEVIIVTTDQQGKEPFFCLDPRIQTYDLGINYEENNGTSFINKMLRYPFKQFCHKRKLSRLLRRLRADVVISMFCNDVSFISSINDGSFKLLEIHFSKFKRLQYGRRGIWYLFDYLMTKQDERLVRKFDKFIVLTQEDRDYWGSLPNIDVIANPLTFSDCMFSSGDPCRAIAVGRYDYQKGFDMLISAWSIVNTLYPEWHLDIIGDGPLKRELQQEIDARSLSGSINLLEPTNRVEEHYSKASFLVMSSRYEGLPMVLLEAQSFGLPVVSFACKCGPRDIITHGGDGFLVPPADVAGLANHIIDLISDRELRRKMGVNARKSSERFTQEKIMNKWISLFRELQKIR